MSNITTGSRRSFDGNASFEERLLAELLSIQDQVAREDGKESAAGAHRERIPIPDAGSLEPAQAGVFVSSPSRRRVGTMRPVAAAISLAAALVVVAAVAVPFVAHRPSNSRGTNAVNRPVRGPSSWKFAGYISQPSWNVQASIGSDPYDLVCPSATTCYGTGPSGSGPSGSTTSATAPQDVVEFTHDGGATWQSSPLPSGGATMFGGVTCPDASTCMTVGVSFDSPDLNMAMFATIDGGRSWTTLPMPGESLDSPVLSCATPMACVAIGSDPGPGGLGEEDVSYVTADGGHSWTASALPGTFRAYGLQCFSEGRCIATGQAPSTYDVTGANGFQGSAAAIYSTDGGATWARGAFPTADVVSPISCSDAQHCMAIEYSDDLGSSAVVVTGDGGETWSVSPTNGGVPEGRQLHLGGVSCPTPTNCWVSGFEYQAGASYSAISMGTTQGVILATHDGGRSWSSEELPTVGGEPIRDVEALGCSTATDCLALADQTPTGPLQQPVVLSNGIGTLPPATSSSVPTTSVG
jgi:photosystem II stability/assembly factor-like uncharacterized protein